MYQPNSIDALHPSKSPLLAPLLGNLTPREAGLLAQAKRKAAHAEWEALAADPASRLRQSFMDEAFMRAHLRVAGIKVGHDLEPATVPRVRLLLRRAGLDSAAIRAAVGPELKGCPLGHFLRLNPRLPLWAAVALVLESDGRITSEAFALRDAQPTLH